MYRLLRPLLFTLEPERAHATTLALLQLAQRLKVLSAPRPRATRPVSLLGLEFPNRIGLAAGFDKNAACVDALAALGFGFVEVGTVTPRPQPGNPSPRIFRLRAAQAIVNQMGFPNAGAALASERVLARRSGCICGINIGKNAATPIEEAARDYVEALRIVYRAADYVVVNVSSPNTRGLRQLLTPELLDPLLAALLQARAELTAQLGRRVPLLLKLSPELADEELSAIAAIIVARSIDGVIATNTTVQRPGVDGLKGADRPGGLSGPPLRPLALGVVRALRARLGANVPIIGVGGIDSVAAAGEMLAAGADLLQIYTGLVYHGPRLVRRLAHL
jgi:dihydroorotate dehydrogenase